MFRSEICFRTTRELEYLFFLSRKARNFFPEFNIRLYDKNSESDYFFFLHQNQNIFFSNIGNQNIFLEKNHNNPGFLRVFELLNIQSCDVLFYQSHMSIFIHQSKTDIYRDGDRIVIARIGNQFCSVKNLENYLEWSCNPSDSDVYLFRNLTKSKRSFYFP